MNYNPNDWDDLFSKNNKLLIKNIRNLTLNILLLIFFKLYFSNEIKIGYIGIRDYLFCISSKLEYVVSFLCSIAHLPNILLFFISIINTYENVFGIWYLEEFKNNKETLFFPKYIKNFFFRGCWYMSCPTRYIYQETAYLPIYMINKTGRIYTKSKMTPEEFIDFKYTNNIECPYPLIKTDLITDDHELSQLASKLGIEFNDNIYYLDIMNSRESLTLKQMENEINLFSKHIFGDERRIILNESNFGLKIRIKNELNGELCESDVDFFKFIFAIAKKKETHYKFPFAENLIKYTSKIADFKLNDTKATMSIKELCQHITSSLQ